MRAPVSWTDTLGLAHAAVDITGDDETDHAAGLGAVSARVRLHLTELGADPAGHGRLARLRVARSHIRWNGRAIYSEQL